MSTPESQTAALHDGINVNWSDVVRFMRQVSHDLRNQLNAVELQSAFLSELATDGELKDEIRRLRKMVSECGAALQKLSVRLNPPSPNIMSYGASDLIEDLKVKVSGEFPGQASSITWKMESGKESVAVDPQLLQDAVLEVVRNAVEHQVEGASLDFIATTEGDNLVITLHEPKTEFTLGTEQWGREPLHHVNRGHYGLGLNRARTIIEGQGGKLQARYDETKSRLITRFILPLARSS